jgi:hypothetical protein
MNFIQDIFILPPSFIHQWSSVVTVYWAQANSYVVTKFGQFLMILYYTKMIILKFCFCLNCIRSSLEYFWIKKGEKIPQNRLGKWWHWWLHDWCIHIGVIYEVRERQLTSSMQEIWAAKWWLLDSISFKLQRKKSWIIQFFLNSVLQKVLI